MNRFDNLGQIVDAGSSVWTARSVAQLAAALEQSGSNGARDLRAFCQRVKEWLHNREGTADEGAVQSFQQRWHWVETVASSFLLQLPDAKIDVLVEQFPGIDERVEFLGILFDCGVHERLLPAAAKLGHTIAQSVSAARADDAEGKRWAGTIRRMLYLCARSSRTKNAAETLADLLRALLWETLEKRLADAPPPSVDTEQHGRDPRDEEITEIGCAKLPGSRDSLRQLREFAVRALQERYEQITIPMQHWQLKLQQWPFKKFAELLELEEPDLYATLTQHPYAKPPSSESEATHAADLLSSDQPIDTSTQ